eukprot:4375832-Alexandrium_andersonii.AAC.1
MAGADERLGVALAPTPRWEGACIGAVRLEARRACGGDLAEGGGVARPPSGLGVGRSKAGVVGVAELAGALVGNARADGRARKTRPARRQ